MGRVAHHGVRLRAPPVPGNLLLRAEDAHVVEADEHLDWPPHETVRHAVAHCVDVDEAVGRHAPLESAATHRQRRRGQRAQGGLFVALEAQARGLVRRTVDALVDVKAPLCQMRLERRE